MDYSALWVSLKLAVATTLVLAAAGLPLGYWLARTSWPGRFVIEALVSLPIVLPPTVLGFYLLLALGPRSPLGRAIESTFGQQLPFTFAGILVGSVLFNMPFAVRPFTAAFASVDHRLEEASWCLGISRLRTFWRVVLPLAWPGVLTGLVLTFARTVGEFGVVLMVGGNIPGVTRTLAIQIYDQVQAMEYAAANTTAAGLLVFSLVVLCAVYAARRKWSAR